jgi:hypothetical protein
LAADASGAEDENFVSELLESLAWVTHGVVTPNIVAATSGLLSSEATFALAIPPIGSLGHLEFHYPWLSFEPGSSYSTEASHGKQVLKRVAVLSASATSRKRDVVCIVRLSGVGRSE